MKTFMIVFVLLGSYQSLAGGVKLKKAIKKGNKEISAQAEKLNKACGSKIKVSSKHEVAAGFKVDGRTPENVAEVSATVCSGHLSNLTSLCKDEDYKSAIAAFRSIVCIPDASLRKVKGKSQFSNKVGVFTIKHHPVVSGGSDSYTVLENSL